MASLLEYIREDRRRSSAALMLAILTVNSLLLFFLNIPYLGISGFPAFALLGISLFFPWMVVLGKYRGVTILINTLLTLAIIAYYLLHGSIAVGLGEQLGGFRFTLISIQLYLAMILLLAIKWHTSRPKTLESLGMIAEDEYVKSLKHPIARFGARAFSWLDALLDAGVMVIFINIFIFQLYMVPTESMVPTFLVNDRPFVIKITEGPKLPVTNFGLPRLRQPKRGDIVVVRNPRYDQSPAAEAKKLLSDVVYMLTFTGVLIDKYDDSGQIKSDPLVKRLIGVPGESLEMANQVVYRKVPGGQWQPLENFNAQDLPDLYELPEDVQERIQDFPMDAQTRRLLTRLDQRLEGLWVDEEYQAQLRETYLLADRIRTLAERIQNLRIHQGFAEQVAPVARTIVQAGPGYFSDLNVFSQDLDIAMAMASDSGALDTFLQFLEQPSTYAGDSRFYRTSRALNLLIKTDLARLLSANLAALTGENEVSSLRREVIASLNEYLRYLSYFYLRNFPPFPGEQEVLAQGQYFYMGDNRLNSIDARHGTYHDAPVDEFDPYSMTYTTLIGPRSVPTENLVGWSGFRVFPFDRFGVIKAP